MNKLRCGIIGIGRIGAEFEDSHYAAYRDCPYTELVAVFDLQFDKVQSFPCEIKGLSYKNNMAESKNLDIVSVCTPPETHCQIVCDIAPYVKAIYCEKPIALTLEDADKMIKTCHKYNVILQVNHQRRFARAKFRFNNRITTLTHVFDLIRQYKLKDVELFPVDTDESIFDLTLYRNDERMILNGVYHLFWCLEEKKQSISSGEEAREALRLALEFKEWYERNKRDT